MKRVLVTGATGCIGRHVLPLLVSRGWDVHAVSSRELVPEPGPITWHRADLLNGAEAQSVVRAAKATHLLHLAWYIAPGKWAAAPQNVEWLEAGIGLLRAFRESNGERAVVAGSCLEYDWRYGYCSERRTPCVPHTLYGSCKHALQVVTSALSSDGFSTAWPRVFFLYGPHEHPDRLVPAVVRALLAGQPALCSHGRQVRDYLFVADVADVMVGLLESSVTGPINVGSGRAIALKEIVERIGAIIGRPELIQLGAIPAAPTDTALVVADVERLSTELSWQPSWDFDAGLSRTIDWWRAAASAEAVRAER